MAVVSVACNEQPAPRSVQPPVVQDERIRFPLDSPQRAVLRSQPVVEERIETFRLAGRTVWDESRTARVFSPLGGRITKLSAQPGDAVKSGSTLALLASPELGQAQAEARRAQTDVGLAEKNLARVSELHGHGVIALKEAQSAQAERDRASAEHNRASMRLRLYGASDQVDPQFALRSPIPGIVVERNANPGQEVRPDQAQPGVPPLFVVTDPRHLWVQIDAPEAALAWLRKGGVLRLRSPAIPERVYEARITQILDFVDAQSRTVRLRASVDNSERRLKAEMYITAEIDVDRGAFLRVPAGAVFLRGETQYVFVDEGEGRYRRQQVKAEEAGFGIMRVRSGLAGGERVVTEGGLLLMQLLGDSRR